MPRDRETRARAIAYGYFGIEGTGELINARDVVEAVRRTNTRIALPDDAETVLRFAPSRTEDSLCHVWCREVGTALDVTKVEYRANQALIHSTLLPPQAVSDSQMRYDAFVAFSAAPSEQLAERLLTAMTTIAGSRPAIPDPASASARTFRKSTHQFFQYLEKFALCARAAQGRQEANERPHLRELVRFWIAAGILESRLSDLTQAASPQHLRALYNATIDDICCTSQLPLLGKLSSLGLQAYHYCSMNHATRVETFPSFAEVYRDFATQTDSPLDMVRAVTLYHALILSLERAPHKGLR